MQLSSEMSFLLVNFHLLEEGKYYKLEKNTAFTRRLRSVFQSGSTLHSYNLMRYFENYVFLKRLSVNSFARSREEILPEFVPAAFTERHHVQNVWEDSKANENSCTENGKLCQYFFVVLISAFVMPVVKLADKLLSCMGTICAPTWWPTVSSANFYYIKSAGNM